MNNLTQAIQSPCVRNCCLDRDDICLGCHRSIKEITLWGEADTQTRINILKNAAQRRDAKQAKPAI